MFKLHALIVGCLLGITVGSANADTIQTLDISGTATTEADGSFAFSGSLSIDLTTSSIQSLNLGLPSIFIDTDAAYSNLSLHLAGLVVDDGSPESAASIFLAPTGAGPYSSGTLSASSLGPPASVLEECELGKPTPCNAAVSSFSAVLAPAPAPLPAALPLFASGLGALGLLARRRKRKAALAA